MNKVDGTLPSSEMSGEEVQRLQEENLRLRSLLITHGIPIPEVANPTGPPPRISGSESNPKVGTAAQRITLFRSLFRGRNDVYAIRWENADGRTGYMPKVLAII